MRIRGFIEDVEKAVTRASTRRVAAIRLADGATVRLTIRRRRRLRPPRGPHA